MKNDPHVTIKYTEPQIPAEAPYFAKEDVIPAFNIKQFFQTVSGAPSGVPTSFIDQIRIANVGPSVYLYIYDFSFGGWRRLQF